MEVIGLASSIISIKEIGLKALNRLRTHSDYDGALEYLDIEIYLGILQEISKIMLSCSQLMPETAESCLRLCHVNLRQVESLTYKSKMKFTLDMEKRLKKFKRAVQLLRDIVMDAITYKLLQQQQNFQDEQLKIIELLRVIAEEGISQQRQADVENLAEKLRSMAQSTPPWQPDTSDPFSFSATILRAHEDDSEHTVVRGKLDSGCDENWVSTEVLTRAGIEDQVEPIEDSTTYTAFGGEKFKPVGKIDITWYAVNASKSRSTTFFVHHGVPFDMVLGRIFIAEESIFVFNKPALALRMGKFTKEEHRIIEENARKKGATNEQLSSIRRADDAAARDRLRQQKTGSRMSLSSGLQTPNSQLSSLSRSVGARWSQKVSHEPSRSLSESQVS